MLLSFIVFTALVALSRSAILPSPLLVTYWGQDMPPTQQPLRAYCDLGYNVIVLSFIDRFGNETFHMQMNSVSCSTNDTEGCAAIASDIAYCKSHNVKILISMGGATVHDCGAGGCTGEYRFDHAAEASKTAEEMYYMFFADTANNSYLRPFGDVQLDGVDLDIEETTAGHRNYQRYYDTFIKNLREYPGADTLIVSAAPVCHHGCASGNCNPLEQTVNLTSFDYLFVQFYNNAYCSLLKPGFNASLEYWLGLQGPNSNAMVVLGVLGDARGQDETDPTYFVSAEQIVSVYSDKHRQNSRVNGIGIWQASTNTTEPQFFPVIQQGLGLPGSATSTTISPPKSTTTSPSSSSKPSTSSGASSGYCATSLSVTISALILWFI